MSSFIFASFPLETRLLVDRCSRRQTALFVRCENELLHKIKELKQHTSHSTYVSYSTAKRWEGPQKKICHIIISHSNVIIKYSKRGLIYILYSTSRLLDSSVRFSKVFCWFFISVFCVFEDQYYTICTL